MAKIRILHITQSNGGVAEYLKMFFKYSNQDDYENTLVCPLSYKEEENFIKEKGCKVHYIDMVRNINFFDDLKSISKIRKYIKKNNPNIIYAHSSKAGALVRIAALFNKTPIIYNSHGWSFDMNISNKKKKFYIYIERFLGHTTSKIINISKNDFELALKYKIGDKKNNLLIENGVDIEKYLAYKKKETTLDELGLSKKNVIIGMVGRISDQKSPFVFLEIAKKIKKSLPNAHFIIVGDGELKVELVNRLRKYNLENSFTITGWTNEVEKYISIFDIALLTSKWEGFGLVIVEYLISKKPVIASNVGGIKNIIKNNTNGILVDKLSVDIFVEKILELQKDKTFRDYLVINGYNDAIRKYNVKKTVKEHEIVFKKLLER